MCESTLTLFIIDIRLDLYVKYRTLQESILKIKLWFLQMSPLSLKIIKCWAVRALIILLECVFIHWFDPFFITLQFMWNRQVLIQQTVGLSLCNVIYLDDEGKLQLL